MQFSNINKIGIQITDSMGFFHELQKMPKKVMVTKPYTINEIERAPQIYTNGVKDCCVPIVVVKNKLANSLEGVLSHLDSEKKENSIFRIIEEKILEKVNNDEIEETFLYGSKEIDKELIDYLEKSTKGNKDLMSFMLDGFEKISTKSIDFMNNLKVLFKENFKKPCTEIRGFPLAGANGSIAFNGQERKYILQNSMIDTVKEEEIKTLIPKVFAKAELSPNNFFMYG